MIVAVETFGVMEKRGHGVEKLGFFQNSGIPALGSVCFENDLFISTRENTT
jgi:hypothetical protein